MKNRFFPIICVIFIFSGILFAQDDSMLSVDRIFGENEFREAQFGPARWLDSGDGYTTLEASETIAGKKDIILYDTQSGKRSVLISADRLVPKGASQALSVEDYEWSPDKKMLLIFTNSKKVWRYNTRGDYWILNLNNWNLQQAGGDAKPSTLMFAKFSPDSKHLGYVSERNLYVEDIQSAKIIQLTHDGSDTIVNGTSDWVYEEEFDLRDGFRWSPDGRKIAYWKFDTEGVGTFYMINNTDSIYSKIIPLEYPKAGTTNSACRVGVINASGGNPTWFDVPGDPRNNYIPKMEWAANSEEIVIQQLNRLQNTNNVMLGNAENGSTKLIITETDDAWLDVGDDLKWLTDGKYFTWLSERSGWKSMYLVSRGGKEISLLTPGNFDVISVEKIDTKNGWVYFNASPGNATQRYLFRSQLKKNGITEKLSPKSQKGTHSYDISPDSKWAFHTYSNFETPPVISIINLPEHKTIRIMEDNAELREKLAKLKRQKTEFFKIKTVDDVEMDAWFIKPPDFDPSKKYPLFIYVYGEPASQTVLDKWFGSRYLWHLMLAQKGYLVISIDNRGTPAPKGRAWRKSIYGQIGILASSDQAAAVRKLIASRPYIDADRVGSWGWSGGGQMTLNALFRYPDLYKTGIAVSFVSDQRLYDTVYQERYMGLPHDNIAGYKNGSPITFANQLKGNLLIIHGTGDDNVHYQSFEKLVNELIAKNKTFTMMSYPNRTHSIAEGKNTRRHLYNLMERYLTENLEPGPK